MRAAVTVEGGAGGTETLPQLVLHRLGQVDFPLGLLPRIKQLVHARMRVLPVNLLGILLHNRLGFSHDLFAGSQGALTVGGTVLLLLLSQLTDAFGQGC